MGDVNFMKGIIYLLIFLGVLIGLFMLIRSFVLWYWRVDDIVKNQLHQIKLLKDQNTLLEDIVKQSKNETQLK